MKDPVVRQEVLEAVIAGTSVTSHITAHLLLAMWSITATWDGLRDQPYRN